jgi:hypothetical protein
MNLDTSNLLKQLSFHGQLAGVGGGTTSGVSNPASASFASLLQQAREGTLRTGEDVTIDPESGVKLSADDLARITMAADKAEAAGVRTAMVLVGDQRLLLDVASRAILGPASIGSEVTSGVDGVIDLRTQGAGQVALQGATSTAALAPGAGIAAHPGVLRALLKSA